MIPREKSWLLFTTCTFLLIIEVKLQSGRAYDTNEWIPVTPTSLKENLLKNTESTSASDRVLSLDAPAQKFFPSEEYEHRRGKPHQDQQFLRQSSVRKGAEHPRPRKLKHPSEYKFETPPPPPLKNQPQINYYNGQNMSPYVFEQPTPSRVAKPITQQFQQSYYAPNQQVPNQRPIVDSYVAVPSISPQAPAPNAPNLYEQYQLPFNASFYQSLNPALLNNELYQAISNTTQKREHIPPQLNLPVVNQPILPLQPAIEKETVQLVYVPIENLKPNQQLTQDTRNIYQQADIPKQETVPLNTVLKASQVPNLQSLDQPRQEKLVYNPPYLQQRPEVTYQQINSPKAEKLVAFQESSDTKQKRLENIQQDFVNQALQAHKLQQQLRDDINPLKQDLSSVVPKPNRKPHQPPLAVFMESHTKAEISDVLDILRGANTISVQDTVTPDSPKIFIGPSNLDSPDGYTKFPLPYLNNINGNRIERKIDQLPFFVAPVSYKTPPGYSKIPLPSPHVGSVVVSVPSTTSTTPEPVILNQNQFNPYTFSPTSYSPLDPPTPSRVVQNYIDNYETSDQGRNRYQSTPAPQITESPLIPPVRDIFGTQFTPPQPDVYYTQQNIQQTYRDSVPNLDIYGSGIQEENRHTPTQENIKQTTNTVRSKENAQVASQLPNFNPLELAINEFELHQINDQFEQPNKKVKHSTTRRPQSNRNYEDSQTVSSTRATVSRGRHTYDLDSTTEKPASRGRVRGRGRGSSSKTVTTTTTTTPAPIEDNRYTVLEEFVAREPTRDLSTESYGRFSAETETESPRRSTTPLNRNAYLPEEGSQNKRTQLESSEDRGSYPNYENVRSQTSHNEGFESNKQQSTFENSRSQAQLEESTERRLPQNHQHRQLADSQTKFDTRPSQNSELETPPSPLDITKPQIVQQPNHYYDRNTEIENIPASVYSLGQPQTYDSTAFDFDSSKNIQEPTKLFYESVQNNENINTDILKNARPLLEETKPVHSHRFNPELVSYENREPNQQLRPREKLQYKDYDNNALPKQVVESETYQSPSSVITDQVLEEHKPQPQKISNPSEFLENLFQPNFDQTYLSLQDQAVRSLLVPNLLAPSTKQQPEPVNPTNEEVISSTEAVVELPSSTEAEITTTTRATRTRGRGRARQSTTSATITSAPRRTASRRRPISRTSTERIASSTEYSSREDNERSSSNTKHHFRTRGRPSQVEISDRISTTENDIRALKEPTHAGGFQVLNSQEPPQSYMQFEHAIDEEQIITINPNFNQEIGIQDYQVSNLPVQSTTERQQLVLEYENTREQPTPVVDVHISHVGLKENIQNSDIITKPSEDEQYVRYHNSNFKSGGVLNNNKPVTTTRVPTTKTRGRTRGRSRFASSTTTTSRPVTRISTSAPIRTTTQPPEEQEFYGFIRQPAYSQKSIQAQKPTQIISRDDEPSIHFVGEIRPKYNPRKTTSQVSEELESAETPRPRVRARTRAPARKTTNPYRASDNEVNSSKSVEQVTRRPSTIRGRVRGSTHYRAPEYQKRESDDEDVANQNYPVNFLQKLDVSSPAPTSSAFKITVDPLDQDMDDQSPHPSIYRPKFVAKPDGWSDPNSLPVEDKPVSAHPEEITPTELKEEIFGTEKPQALAVVQTTQSDDELFTQFTDSEIENTMTNLETIKTSPTEQTLTTLEPTEQPATQKTSKRKGTWKLVRHRPLDPLEVSESQNYQSVIKVFNSIEKIDPYIQNKPNRVKSSSGKNFYSKEGVNSKNSGQESNSFGDHFENQYFDLSKDVEEIVTVVSEKDSISTDYATDIDVDDSWTTTPSTFKTQENIFETIYEMFGIFNKQEEKKNETIVPSRENLHKERENLHKEMPITTTVSPIFPEEITEDSSTTSTEKIDETFSNEDEENEKNNSDRTGSTEKIVTTTSDMKPLTKPYEVEPWEMKAIKTSTSTEVSHETEICYKGRCVKSKD